MSVAETAPPAAPTGSETAKLHRRALGVPDLVFFIVAASAPLTAVAGGQAATYLVTGNRGVAFMFIPLGIVLGLFAVGYAAMSRHVANAGAFYAYVARGLGQGPGRRRRVRRAARLQRDADRHLRPVRRRDGRVHGRQDRDHARLVVVVRDRGRGHRRARDAEDRPQRARARRPADPRGARRRAVRLRDRRRPRPAGPDHGRVRPDDRVRLRRRRDADVLRGVVRRLRVGGDLQRGVPRPEAHRRPRDVHRRRPDRGLLRALQLAAGRRRRAGHDRLARQARRRRLRHQRRAGPDHGAVHHRPGPARRVLGRRRVAAVRHVAVRRAAVLPQRGLALHVRARPRARAAVGRSGA